MSPPVTASSLSSLMEMMRPFHYLHGVPRPLFFCCQSMFGDMLNKFANRPSGCMGCQRHSMLHLVGVATASLPEFCEPGSRHKSDSSPKVVFCRDTTPCGNAPYYEIYMYLVLPKAHRPYFYDSITGCVKPTGSWRNNSSSRHNAGNDFGQTFCIAKLRCKKKEFA